MKLILETVTHGGLETSAWVQVGVAVITLALAGVTGWLAWQTRKVAQDTKAEAEAVSASVSVAEKQVRVSHAAYVSSILPWLVSEPLVEKWGTGQSALKVSMEVKKIENVDEYFGAEIGLKNIGNGLAILPEKGISVHRADGNSIDEKDDYDTSVRAATYCRPQCIGKESSGRVGFRIAFSSPADRWKSLDDFAGRTEKKWGRFFIDVKFTDAAAAQELTARFEVAIVPWPSGPDELNEYHVTATTYLGGDKTIARVVTPFADYGRLIASS